jgi:hypothetical protein
MKKLLIILAITSPLWALAFYGKKHEAPKPTPEPQVIWEPPVRVIPIAPQVAPTPPAVPVPRHRVTVKPKAPPPPVSYKATEMLPPPADLQVTPPEYPPLRCIFPFSLIPNCRPAG